MVNIISPATVVSIVNYVRTHFVHKCSRASKARTSFSFSSFLSVCIWLRATNIFRSFSMKELWHFFAWIHLHFSFLCAYLCLHASGCCVHKIKKRAGGCECLKIIRWSWSSVTDGPPMHFKFLIRSMARVVNTLICIWWRVTTHRCNSRKIASCQIVDCLLCQLGSRAFWPMAFESRALPHVSSQDKSFKSIVTHETRVSIQW